MSDDAVELGRRVRAAYEALGAGPINVLRRCPTGDDVREVGWFYRICNQAGASPADNTWLAHLVACFRAAEHREDDGFRLGAHLRSRIYEKTKLDELPRRAIPFRRLLAARDRDDLAHQLRRLIHRAAQPRDAGAKVDWGKIGHDIKYFGDAVRRNWATGFYTADLESEGTVLSTRIHVDSRREELPPIDASARPVVDAGPNEREAAQPPSKPSTSVEDALAGALTAAAAAGRWDVVTQLAKELEARRLARAAS